MIDFLKKCTHELKEVITVLRVNRGVKITMSHFIAHQSNLMRQVCQRRIDQARLFEAVDLLLQRTLRNVLVLTGCFHNTAGKEDSRTKRTDGLAHVRLGSCIRNERRHIFKIPPQRYLRKPANPRQILRKENLRVVTLSEHIILCCYAN